VPSHSYIAFCLSLSPKTNIAIRQIIKHTKTMESTVTELLREFPRVKRAVLSGETVIIKTRDGNFRLTLDSPATGGLLGCMKGLAIRSDNNIDRPTTEPSAWDPKL